MQTITVYINDRVASFHPDAFIVADNDEWRVQFKFDDEWKQFPVKAARIFIGDTFTQMLFREDYITLPRMPQDIGKISIGVYAYKGTIENLTYSSTTIEIPVKPSALTDGGGEFVPVVPEIMPMAESLSMEDTFVVNNVTLGRNEIATIAQIFSLVGGQIITADALVQILTQYRTAAEQAAIDRQIIDQIPTQPSEIGAPALDECVLTIAQLLTAAQKAQARTNIGAGTYSKPNTGIPASDLASGVIPQNVVQYVPQTLTDYDKNQARENIGAGTYSKPNTGIPSSDLASGVIPENVVLYTAQTLTDSQKTQARTNIGAGTYSKPSTGTPASDLASGVIPDDIFFATYNTTTAQDLVEAWEAGKVIYCYYQDVLYTCTRRVSNNFAFSAMIEDTNYQLIAILISSTTVWSNLASRFNTDRESTVSTGGAVTQSLAADVMYHFTGALTSLTITFASPINQAAHYHFDFDEGSTAFDPTLPNGVVLPDNHTWEADTHYEVDILNNYAVVVGWAVS